MQKITCDNYIRLHQPIFLEREIQNIFTLKNPEYISLCRQRRIKPKAQPKGFIISRFKEKGKWKSKKIPEFLFYFSYINKDLCLPRESLFELKKLYKENKIKYKIQNKRIEHKKIKVKFHGTLDKERGQAKIQEYGTKGIIQAHTGVGKTVLSLYKLAEIKQPAIIVVHTNELAEQWKNRIKQFLKIKKIGFIGAGKKQIEHVTVALVQSLKKETKVLNKFGLLIIDEAHIAATESYAQIVNNYKGKHIIGLSATPRRSDGKTKVMFWLLGEIKCKIEYSSKQVTPTKVKFVPTEFKSFLNFQYQYSKALNTLKEDEQRNKLIIQTCVNFFNYFGVHLILSQSTKHLELLMNLMPPTLLKKSKLLVGKIKKSDRKEIIKQIEKEEIKYVFATQQLIGTGFDSSILSVLHLTTPIKNPDQLKQYIGRITRLHPGKKECLIFDYFDKYEFILKNTAGVRSKTYKKLKIERL